METKLAMHQEWRQIQRQLRRTLKMLRNPRQLGFLLNAWHVYSIVSNVSQVLIRDVWHGCFPAIFEILLNNDLMIFCFFSP